MQSTRWIGLSIKPKVLKKEISLHSAVKGTTLNFAIKNHSHPEDMLSIRVLAKKKGTKFFNEQAEFFISTWQKMCLLLQHLL